MPDLDNDNDSLFRMAAENYRPVEAASGWQKVYSAIEAGHTKKNTRRRMLFVVLLFSCCSATLLLLNKYAYRTTGYASSKNMNTDAGYKNNTAKNIHTPNNDKKQSYTAQLIPCTSLSQEDRLLNNKPAKVSLATAKATLQISTESAETSNTDSLMAVSIEEPHYLEKTKPEIKSIAIANTELAKNKPAQIDNKVFEDSNSIREKSINKQPNTEIAANKKSGATRFYFGISASIEFGGVKQIYFKNPGFKVGGMAGYQINSRFAAEAALHYSKKTYFCNGSYFKMSNSGLPTDVKLSGITGICKQLEIPLRFTYTASKTERSKLTVAAGISSFFTNGETNVYNTITNNIPEKISCTYRKRSFYFASSAEIAFGLEKKLNNSSSLRLQPYMQLALRETGIGKMKLINTGLYVIYIFQKKK